MMGIMYKKIFCFLLFYIFILHSNLYSYTADWVDIKRQVNGKYRVIIRYTDLKVGEYRRAHIDFHSKDKLKAIKAFQDLARGSDFYFGSSDKTIRFQKKESHLKTY